MFWSRAVEAVGKEQHNAALTEPFRCECFVSVYRMKRVRNAGHTLGRRDERIDHHLRAIEEVSELHEGGRSETKGALCLSPYLCFPNW